MTHSQRTCAFFMPKPLKLNHKSDNFTTFKYREAYQFANDIQRWALAKLPKITCDIALGHQPIERLTNDFERWIHVWCSHEKKWRDGLKPIHAGNVLAAFGQIIAALKRLENCTGTHLKPIIGLDAAITGVAARLRMSSPPRFEVVCMGVKS